MASSQKRGIADLLEMSSGTTITRVLQVAVHFNLFDAIPPSGATAGQVARAISTHPDATGLLLNALAGMRVLRKKGGRFYHTAASRRYLVTTSPRYFGHMIKFDTHLLQYWGQLEEVIRTGNPAKERDMFQGRPQETELFINAMHGLVMARGDADYLARRLDLSPYRSFLDLGGGPGTYAIRFCQANPHLRATILDLPGTLAVTRRYIEKFRMQDRISLLEADYTRDPIRGSFDIVFASNIIHLETPETNQRLAETIYGSLTNGGWVLIKDHVLNRDLTQPVSGSLFSITMLLFTPGRSYGGDEIRGWLKNVGFREIREIPLPPPMSSSLVIGRKGRGAHSLLVDKSSRRKM